MSFLLNPFVLRRNSDAVFFCIGDSQMTGQGDVIPPLAAGVAEVWEPVGNTWNSLTTQSCNPDDPTKGSMFQYFASQYNATYGAKCCIYNAAYGGSGMIENGSGGYWAVAGGGANKITPAITEMNVALAAKGMTKPTAVFISVGHVDGRDNTPLATMQSGAASLMNSITTAYPGVPILWMVCGRVGTAASDALDQSLYNIRRVQMDIMNTYTDVHCFVNALSIAQYPSAMQADFLHMNNVGLQLWGNMFFNWFGLSTYSKFSRGVLASMFTPLSTTRNNLIAQVIDGLVSRGDLFELEHLCMLKQTDIYNAAIDWTFISQSFNGGSTFNTNGGVTTDGSSNAYFYGWLSGLTLRAANQNDIIEGTYLSAKTTAAGVVGVVFGVNNTGVAQRSFFQNVSNVSWRVHDSATPVGADAAVTAPNFYSIFRTSTTKQYKINKTNRTSAVTASTGLEGTFFPALGALGGSSLTFYYGGTYQFVFAARHTTFDFDSFYDDVMNMINNW